MATVSTEGSAGEPSHAQRQVVEAAQEQVGGRAAHGDDLSKIIRSRVDQFLVRDEAERSASHRPLLAFVSVLLSPLHKIVDHGAPRSADKLRIVC